MKTCSKCKSKPALSYHAYCYDCVRKAKGQPPIPKFRRDNSNKDKCCKCKQRPKAKGKNYCPQCSSKAMKKWAVKHGGYWKALTPEQKRRAKVRAFINHKITRGQIQRLPCIICGNQSTQNHHLNYKSQTLDVLFVCHDHHIEIERLKKRGLTDLGAVEYVLSQLRD